MNSRIEFELIEHLRAILPPLAMPQGTIAIGDDCAVLPSANDGYQLVTTDLLMEGTHFLGDQHSPEQIAAKLFGVNLSDIAAMGGIPTALFLSVALPKSHGRQYAASLYAAFAQQAQKYGLPILGGDTNSWDGPLVVNATVLGTASAFGPVLRSGGQPGDVLYVSGPLGGSLAGRHLSPVPQLELGLWLAENFMPSAMLDISDGLLADLQHLLGNDVHGARLQASQIPIHFDATNCGDDRSPLEHACNDGEDFELLFALTPQKAEEMEAKIKEQPFGAGVRQIGVLAAEQGTYVLDEQGKDIEIARGGWTHEL